MLYRNLLTYLLTYSLTHSLTHSLTYLRYLCRYVHGRPFQSYIIINVHDSFFHGMVLVLSISYPVILKIILTKICKTMRFLLKLRDDKTLTYYLNISLSRMHQWLNTRPITSVNRMGPIYSVTGCGTTCLILCDFFNFFIYIQLQITHCKKNIRLSCVYIWHILPGYKLYPLVSICIACRRLHLSCIGDKTVVTATCMHFYPRIEHCSTMSPICRPSVADVNANGGYAWTSQNVGSINNLLTF